MHRPPKTLQWSVFFHSYRNHLLEQSKKLKSSVPQACDTEQEIDINEYTEQSDETGTVVA